MSSLVHDCLAQAEIVLESLFGSLKAWLSRTKLCISLSILNVLPVLDFSDYSYYSNSANG